MSRNSVRNRVLAVLLTLLVIAPSQGLAQQVEYPKAKKVDQVDDYHGTEVADPYRWLEDVDSDETMAWVNAENEITFAYLDMSA